jgi:hypothetical protein
VQVLGQLGDTGAAESAIDVDAARQQARDGVRRAVAADGPPDLDPGEYVDGRSTSRRTLTGGRRH